METASYGTRVSCLTHRKGRRTDSLSSTVIFRLTVFRPFPSEVILARVKSSDEDGIQCVLFLLNFYVRK